MTGSNVLCNADGGPDGVGSILTVPNGDLASGDNLLQYYDYCAAVPVGQRHMVQWW